MLSTSRLIGLFLVLLGSTSAFSQSATLQIATTPSPFGVTAAMCNATPAGALSFTVTGNVTIPSGNPTAINVYVLSTPVGGSTCPDVTFPTLTGTAVNVDPTAPFYSQFTVSGSVNLDQSSFSNPTVKNLNSQICAGTAAQGVQYALCAYAVDGNTNAVYAKSAAAPLTLNTVPATVSLTGVVAGDALIGFTVGSNQNETTGINICYIQADPNTGIFDPADVSALAAMQNTNNACSGGSTSSSFGLRTANPDQQNAIPGSASTVATAKYTWSYQNSGLRLVNGTKYRFVVQGRTGLVWSTPSPDTIPVPQFSTLQLYDGAGNAVSWACAQSAGPVTPAVALTLAFLVLAALMVSPRRRSRVMRFLTLGLFCFGLMSASEGASANAGQFVLGLTGSFYKPNFDKNTTYPVYAKLYSDGWMPKFGLDFDWHLFDPFGSIQLGFASSFAWATGYASLTGPNTNYTPGGASTAMYLLRADPRLTYVFDKYQMDFPLVPFIQAGIDVVGYYITYQGGADTKGQGRGVNPLGMKFGWQFGGGLMLMLDWLEPEVAAGARATGTYNHVYLKTTASYVKIDDFGSQGFDLSPAHFGASFPLQLDFAIVFDFQ